MTTIFIGLYLYSFAPILGDTSIYLVAVYVLLALFVTLREDSMFGRTPLRFGDKPIGETHDS
ncbi:MAG: hypothetical protein ABSD49_01165 [Candidatus Bathyarchaeia archaeon]|jgi:hypothetical protein